MALGVETERYTSNARFSRMVKGDSMGRTSMRVNTTIIKMCKHMHISVGKCRRRKGVGTGGFLLFAAQGSGGESDMR